MGGGPLRKITGMVENKYGIMVEALECGHTVHTRSDAFGKTYPVRRRCWQCRQEAEKAAEQAEADRLKTLIRTPKRGKLKAVPKEPS